MNIKDFAQPTILSGKQYGTTITIELDHSDTSIDEVMDGFLTIAKGLGYLDSTINEWIKDKAKDVYDDEHTIVKNAFAEDWFETFTNTDTEEEVENEWGNEEEPMEDLLERYNNPKTRKHLMELRDEDETIDWDEERIDIIGQNGNEGTHYGIATDEDIEECELNEKQLKDYKGVYVEKPHFDWNDGIEEMEDEFDIDEFDDYGKRIEKNGK